MALLKLLNGSLSVKVGMGNWEMEWGECEEWLGGNAQNVGNGMEMQGIWVAMMGMSVWVWGIRVEIQGIGPK